MRFFFSKFFFSNHQSNTFVTVLLLYCDKPLLFEVVIEFFHSSALEKKVCSLRSAMTSSKKKYSKNLKKNKRLRLVIVIRAQFIFNLCFKCKCVYIRIVLFIIITYSTRAMATLSRFITAPLKKHANFSFLFHS